MLCLRISLQQHIGNTMCSDYMKANHVTIEQVVLSSCIWEINVT